MTPPFFPFMAAGRVVLIPTDHVDTSAEWMPAYANPGLVDVLTATGSHERPRMKRDSASCDDCGVRWCAEESHYCWVCGRYAEQVRATGFRWVPCAKLSDNRNSHSETEGG